MARKTPLRRKRRTREHVIADLSVNHLERWVLLARHTIERLTHDYGIDLMIKTFSKEGEIQVGEILVQMKATDELTLNRQADAVRFRVDRRDLLSWLDEPMPVILVLFDAANEIGYWLYVQFYFESRPRFRRLRATKTVSVTIPLSQRVDLSAIREFAGFRDRVFEQLKGQVSHHD